VSRALLELVLGPALELAPGADLGHPARRFIPRLSVDAAMGATPALLAALAACALLAAPARAAQTVSATDAAFVTRVGRPYPPSSGGGLGLSWLGGGVRVQHTGRVLRATFAPVLAGFKLRCAQSNDGFFPFQSVAWVAGSNVSETVAVASGAGVVEVVLNMPPQYFEAPGSEAVLISLTTDGAFGAAPAPPALVMHVLGDSITAATNIHGGVNNACADYGYENDYSASYGGLLCGHLGASCSTVAVGGQTMPPMTQYYKQYKYSDSAPFPFDDAAPRIFVSYMGVNDYWGQDGTPALDAEFAANWLAFFNLTRAAYPGAKIAFFLLLGPMIAGGGAPHSPLKMEPGVLKAVADGVAAGFDVTYVNATAACGDALAGCVDGCGGGHPGESGHRAMALAAAPLIAAKLGIVYNPF